MVPKGTKVLPAFLFDHKDIQYRHSRKAKWIGHKECGLYTLFMYLNTPDERGPTIFDDLNLSVSAVAGRAILWPFVLNLNVSARDERTVHEATAVVKGTKYGSNLWDSSI